MIDELIRLWNNNKCACDFINQYKIKGLTISSKYLGLSRSHFSIFPRLKPQTPSKNPSSNSEVEFNRNERQRRRRLQLLQPHPQLRQPTAPVPHVSPPTPPPEPPRRTALLPGQIPRRPTLLRFAPQPLRLRLRF